MNVCYKVTQGTEKEVTFPWVDLRGSPHIEKEGKKKWGATKIFSKMRYILQNLSFSSRNLTKQWDLTIR